MKVDWLEAIRGPDTLERNIKDDMLLVSEQSESNGVSRAVEAKTLWSPLCRMTGELHLSAKEISVIWKSSVPARTILIMSSDEQELNGMLNLPHDADNLVWVLLRGIQNGKRSTISPTAIPPWWQQRDNTAYRFYQINRPKRGTFVENSATSRTKSCQRGCWSELIDNSQP